MKNKGGHHEPSKLPYQLLKQITNDFHEDRILGSGGFGTVYKGVYENRGEVAVKVLHNISGLDDKEFHKEFDNLRGLKHPNIVELVGFCNESEQELVVFEGKQVTAERLRMALCFEYVNNGSLNKLISDENTGLAWHTRYRIIKGICQGLNYLHGELENPIMHFDLKPGNILLDKSMVPKIADFGLSKLFGEENTKKTMSSAGTCGYWPPEYIKHQIVSREFDIFSLGVIIVRIMTGHERYNSIVEMPIRRSVTLVHESWRKRLRGILSHRLLEVYCNQVKRCIEIALDCLVSNRQERPTIQDIVSSLNETETMIGDQQMQNEQLYQDDGQYTLALDISGTTINSRPSSDNFLAVDPRVMSWSLLKKMTNNFSKARLLGHGERATVYKGVYGDGQVVAVKELVHIRGFNDKQVEKNIAILRKLNHQNIVQLIGHCNEKEEMIIQHEGKHIIVESIHMAVCFEYLRSGSLVNYIPPDINSGLDWQTRYGIIKGVCEGLRYLHEGLERPILHMNLKPDNIMVDEKMIPKIGGFGDARLVDVGNTHRTINTVGTWGYMPPEYIEKQVISKEFDIFSLGVIMIKLVTGQHKYDQYFDMPPQEFIQLAHEEWRGRLQKTVALKSVEGYCHQIKKCLEIALMCVESNRHRRPVIGDMVHTLNGTETSLLPQLDSELLHVHPMELCFLTPMSSSMEAPRKKKRAMMSSSCSLKLHNKGNDRVAFMLVANSPSKYQTKEPLCGIVPPRCLYTLTLTMRNSNKQPLSSSSADSGADFFTLHGIVVSEYDLLNVDKDFISTKYNDFLKKAKGKADHEVQEVKVLCCQKQEDRGTSSSETTRPTVEIMTTTNAQQVSSIDVHPTEPWIITTHHVGSLRVWNYKTMETLNSIQEITDEPVHVAKFIARENWLIAGDSNGCIHVYSYDKHEDILNFDAHDSCITTLAVHPMHPFVLSSSDDVDHLIKLWDWDKGWECTREFQGHTGKVTEVKFNPKESDSFASASLDGTVKIWSTSSNDPGNITTLKLREHVDGYVPESLFCVDYFTRLNRLHLILGCKGGTAQIWELGMKECVDMLEGHEDRVTAVSLHPELPVLVTGSLDGTVRIWNSTTYKLENIICFNLGAVHAFGCIKGSTRIVIGCHQGIAMVEISFTFPDYSRAVPGFVFSTFGYKYGRGSIGQESQAHERRPRPQRTKDLAARLRRSRMIATAKGARSTDIAAKAQFDVSKASKWLADTINQCSLVDKPDSLLLPNN